MKQIWKFKLNFEEEDAITNLELPGNSSVLHFNFQNSTPFLWIAISPELMNDSTLKKPKRKFKIIGTGHDIDYSKWFYIGTVHGKFVWHCIEIL